MPLGNAGDSLPSLSVSPLSVASALAAISLAMSVTLIVTATSALRRDESVAVTVTE